MTNTTETQKPNETKKPGDVSKQIFRLSISGCLLCRKPIDDFSTAYYSARNKAFAHVECRDAHFKALDEAKKLKSV